MDERQTLETTLADARERLIWAESALQKAATAYADKQKVVEAAVRALNDFDKARRRAKP